MTKLKTGLRIGTAKRIRQRLDFDSELSLCRVKLTYTNPNTSLAKNVRTMHSLNANKTSFDIVAPPLSTWPWRCDAPKLAITIRAKYKPTYRPKVSKSITFLDFTNRRITTGIKSAPIGLMCPSGKDCPTDAQPHTLRPNCPFIQQSTDPAGMSEIMDDNVVWRSHMPVSI